MQLSYRVRSGDTLYKIAKRWEIPVESLISANLLSSPYTIYVGQRLSIPSGAEGLIAYFSSRGGHDDLWLFNPRTGANRPLTNGLGASFSTPVWSPDSRRIAFAGKNGVVYVVGVTTGSLAGIDQLDEGEGGVLDWSPDGRKLAYTKRDRILIYDVATHEAHSIQRPGATDVQWFPDGARLLFQAPDASGISQLYRIRTDGTGQQQITRNTEGPLHNVRLSPDGAFALYTTPGVSISIIHTVELATGRVYEVKGGPLAKNYFPEWSPDSMHIAYSATAFEEGRGYYSQIRTVGRRGDNDRVRAVSDCFATPVSWSPNGRKIAYLSGCTEQDFADEMWVVDLRHPEPIRWLDGIRITALQWSPSADVERPEKITYFSPVYKIRLLYPSHWHRVSDERYEGPDGFFQVSAISAEADLGQVCRGEAFHPLRPYGSQPRIIKARVSGQEACFILPSKDQPAEMKGQSALIARYPRPVVIGGTVYPYFILWADRGHIAGLSSTLAFVP